MAKPKSNKRGGSTRAGRSKLTGPANYCRYCAAKIPRGPRQFCNDKHKAAFK